MAQPSSEESEQLWKENILKQRNSGLSIAAWCRQSGIAVHIFYYWQSKLFPKPAFNRSAFTEAVEEKNRPVAGIILEYRGFNIHLNEQFDPAVLKKCLEVLKKC